tara:strand:+ start:81718 stop:82497 length:780 start_codon:yes stop_codon:yes gene_type:complete
MARFLLSGPLQIAESNQSMRNLALLLVVLGSAACGSPTQKHKHPVPLSAEQHEQDALAHERAAELEEQGVEPKRNTDDTRCIDQGQEPLYSGGERTEIMMPCWTQAERSSRHMREAEANRKAAREHRVWAKALVELEATTCSRLSEIDRTTAPLTHVPDILKVEEYKESGKLLGARVTLRKVRWLTTEWVNASIACHQARAAKLGYDASFMPLSPLTLPETGTSVAEQADTIVVIIRSTDPVIAAQIYGRSARILAEQE